MKYNIGDIVICHFDEASISVPERYFEVYQDRVGEITEARDYFGKPSYWLDIGQSGDYFFEDELSPFGGIEFDEVLELID